MKHFAVGGRVLPPILLARNVKQTGKITGIDKGGAAVFLGTGWKRGRLQEYAQSHFGGVGEEEGFS